MSDCKTQEHTSILPCISILEQLKKHIYNKKLRLCMKWYETNYVNHRDWILDNLNLLSLDAKEAIVILMIDFMNEHHLKTTIEDLAKRTNLTNEEMNEVLSLLCAKKYLEIKAANNGDIRFVLNGLFETDVARDEKIMDSSLFDLFESEMGRTLSQKEMQKIAEWNRTTDKKMIFYALREASAYQKLSFSYIDKILQDWKKKGLTLKQIDEGTY